MQDWSINVQEVFRFAQREARKLKHEHISTGHILLGIVSVKQCTALQIFMNLTIDASAMKKHLERILGVGNNVLLSGEIPLNNRAKVIMDIAKRDAWRTGNEKVGTEHLLLAILELEEGMACDILSEAGITYNLVQQELFVIKKSKNSVVKMQGDAVLQETPLLNQYSRDLTYYARIEALDPVIGRNKEIERAIQILSRRTKNNPIFIGDAGVGKTAIVEGLAERIVMGMVPEMLSNKRIVSLDMMRVIAGTKYRGEFEERLKNIIDEIKRNKDRVILFIDEIHTLIGAGSAEGAIDASNMLKPALSRGELQCIGATTITEYRKHIEHDPALERRFQPITIEPPSNEETVEILKGLRRKYEEHHNVVISDEAIVSAVDLAGRYIPSRFFPDKAIDLIDEASASVKIRKDKVSFVNQKAEEEITDKAVVVDNTGKEQSVGEQVKEKPLVKTEIPVVVEQDIAYVVAQWTGIPVARINEEEAEKLLFMDKYLKEEIVGQDEAVHSLAQSVRRSRAGFKDPNRPIGIFMFLGPSGVGKTKCAKALAKFLFGREDCVIRCDMSEYMERHSVSRLIGAPPGYVGYSEGGQLTEAVRKTPYSVILIDEIEKAHPDLANILLQVFDEGTLTDGLGHKIDFKNTVIIMTSNVGTEMLTKGAPLGFRSDDKKKDFLDIKNIAIDRLKYQFKPEFINRIDDIILFQQLHYKEAKKILDIMLKEVLAKIEKQGYVVDISDDVKTAVLEEGYDEKSGVRPLRRVIEHVVEDNIVEGILKNHYPRGSHISLVKEDDKVVAKLKAPVKVKKKTRLK